MSTVPYLKRKAKRAIGHAGRQSERRLAKQLGGRLRPASGAVPGAKSDIALKHQLVEAKSTVGRSIAIQHAWLGKCAAEARSEGKTPVVTISFTTADGRPVPHGSWVLIPLHDWQELTSNEG
jgi:hypothetical protein